MLVASIWPAAIVLATAIPCLTGLVAWRGWLDLKRLELARTCGDVEADPPAAVRIEVADLKERLRKLEAIATGVDL